MAKISASSMSPFFKNLGNSNKMALDTLAELTKQKWYEYIELGWYSLYEPWRYDRQYAILKSLMRTNIYTVGGNSYKVDIYVDFSIMDRYHPNSMGDWNSEQVFQAIETDGFSMANGINRDPSYARENTIQWLKNDYRSFLLKELKSMGYDIK